MLFNAHSDHGGADVIGDPTADENQSLYESDSESLNTDYDI